MKNMLFHSSLDEEEMLTLPRPFFHCKRKAAAPIRSAATISTFLNYNVGVETALGRLVPGLLDAPCACVGWPAIAGEMKVGPLAGTAVLVEARLLEQPGGARTFGFMLGRLAISYTRAGARGPSRLGPWSYRSVFAFCASLSAGTNEPERKPRCGIGLLGRPASESGLLCRGDGDQGRATAVGGR